MSRFSVRQLRQDKTANVQLALTLGKPQYSARSVAHVETWSNKNMPLVRAWLSRDLLRHCYSPLLEVNRLCFGPSARQLQQASTNQRTLSYKQKKAMSAGDISASISILCTFLMALLCSTRLSCHGTTVVYCRLQQ